MTQVLEAITKASKRTKHIALVGHEPDLGELTARLLRSRGTFEFKKGAVCCIELDGAMPTGPGTLALAPAAARAPQDRSMTRAIVVINPLSGRGRYDNQVQAHAALARDVLGCRQASIATSLPTTPPATRSASRKSARSRPATISSSRGAATARSTKPRRRSSAATCPSPSFRQAPATVSPRISNVPFDPRAGAAGRGARAHDDDRCRAGRRRLLLQHRGHRHRRGDCRAIRRARAAQARTARLSQT